MKESEVKSTGCGANEVDASPQPLSKGEGLYYPADSAEGLCDFVAFEGRPPYETGNKEIWGVLKYRARENRKLQTEAEGKLWQSVRASKLGHKIRRQHPIDIYIVDFTCVIKRVIIEIDGGYHLDSEQIQSDNERTFYLEQKGFTVLRFTNADVENDLQTVTSKIKNLLDSLPDIPYVAD